MQTSTSNLSTLQRYALTAFLFALVVLAILMLDPTLRPQWLGELMGMPSAPTPTSTANPDANSSDTESPEERNNQLLGLIDSGVVPKIGEPAPDFALRDLEGNVVQLSDYRGEKYVILNFWATWCTPCVVEMPALDEVYGKYNSELVILGINLQESRDAVVKFVRNEVNVDYPILLDNEGQVMRGYNIFAQPTTMFVDKEGNIAPINKLTGKFGAFTDEELRQRVDELLNSEDDGS